MRERTNLLALPLTVLITGVALTGAGLATWNAASLRNQGAHVVHVDDADADTVPAWGHLSVHHGVPLVELSFRMCDEDQRCVHVVPVGSQQVVADCAAGRCNGIHLALITDAQGVAQLASQPAEPPPTLVGSAEDNPQRVREVVQQLAQRHGVDPGRVGVLRLGAAAPPALHAAWLSACGLVLAILGAMGAAWRARRGTTASPHM